MGAADHGLMGWLMDVREEFGLCPVRRSEEEEDID